MSHIEKHFRLGVNYAREFNEYLDDISRRDGITVDEILNVPEIAEIKQRRGLSYARRMDLLRQRLRFMRFGKPVSKDAFAPKVDWHPHKKISYVEQKGAWLKRCPGTLGHICCNYLVINSISGCPYDCTYCYLQTYLYRPGVSIFTNQDELISELNYFFSRNKGSHFRIGTGEFSDSLALDKETGLSKSLIELFAGQEEHLLELKTKSAEVDHLLDLDHGEKTVFAWSVNPERVVKSEELGAAGLKERMAAAKRCAAAGFMVAFHFDPIIHYEGWEKEYKGVVDLIFSEIKHKDIAWISLGALRYQPKLKEIITQHFPHSKITLGELDVGEDKKMRYLKQIRIDLFTKMHKFIRSRSKDVYVYLCMESPYVWRAAGIKNNPGNEFAKYFRFFKKGR